MRLQANLDLSAAGPLWTQLCASRHQPITLDGSDVERLGGLCLQVLIAAANQWRADGATFALVNASPALAEGLRVAGAPELLGGAA